jgi:hypothetical protein
MALRTTRPLTKMSIRPERNADSFTVICQPIA